MMIGQSIIPEGYVPSLECGQWLHSECKRTEQLRREAYDEAILSAYDEDKWRHVDTLQVFADIAWNAHCAYMDAQIKHADKLLAKGKALLATSAVEKIPF